MTMVAQVQSVKPNAPVEQIKKKINQRIREVMDARIWWADMLVRAVISCPDQYVAGTVSTTNGSQRLTGAGTAWPVSDVVNTTNQDDITSFGYVEVRVGNMDGIKVGGSVYLSDAVQGDEVLPVIRVSPVSFLTRVRREHLSGCAITKSSLADLQIRLGVQYPVFTVMAVIDATTLLIDMPWGGPPVSNVGYQILKMYDGIDPDTKYLHIAVDQQQGVLLQVGRNSSVADIQDPQRTNSGDPLAILNHSPSNGGVMQFEIWPAPTSARQIQVMISRSWPELEQGSDLPPWFINPAVFVNGASADMLRTAVREGISQKDPWQDAALAREYEGRFREGLIAAVNADDAKAIRAYDSMADQLVPGGANWQQQHDPDLFFGRF